MATPLTDVLPQYFFNGDWVTFPVYAEDGPAHIERGYTDEGTIRPSKLTVRLNDAAAPSLNPSRATSPLYGITGRSLPIAISCEGTIRAWLECALMDPDESQSFDESPPRGRRWLDIEAQGPLFRINQWSDIVTSAMTRNFQQYANLIGLWPAEESSSTAQLSTLVGKGASLTGATMGDADGPPGGGGSFIGSATMSMILSPLDTIAAPGFQVFWSSKMAVAPTLTATPLFTWRANGLFFSMDVVTGGFNFRIYDSAMTLISDVPYTWGGTVLTQWVTWRAKCYQSGGNIVVELAWYQESLGGVLGITQSVAGTIDRLTSIRLTGNTATDGTRYAQIGALKTVTDNLQSFAVLQAFLGFKGETTVARWNRALTEAGIAHTVIGTSAQTMGPQKPDTLIGTIKQIAATEDGLVFDAQGTPEIVLRTRRSRMNQTPALALAYDTDVVPPFKERLDNVGVANLIQIEDQSGQSAQASKTTGTMSVAAYPDGIGVFKGAALPDVDTNFANPAADLPLAVAWYLARGTSPGPRFPTVVVEAGLKSPGLKAAVAAVDIGDRITISGRLPDLIDLQVIGISEDIGTHTWKFTFTCIPGDVFNTGGEGSAVHLLDTYANTIITAPAPPSTGTSMVVGSPDPLDVWSTTTLPYLIMVAGETMTVTAATAAALVSGTWRQTLTVTRSVNGVVKAQTVATPVHVAQPIREAW